jgi:hypothetical protein
MLGNSTMFFYEITDEFNLDGELKQLWIENGRKRAVVSAMVHNQKRDNRAHAVVLNVARKPSPREVVTDFTEKGFQELTHILSGDRNVAVFAFRRE